MESTNCKKCKQKQQVENVEHYTTAKGKHMIKMNCVLCKSKLHRFCKKPVVEETQKEIVSKVV